MSFPPGFLDEIKTRLSLSEVAGAKVTWDSRKSNPAKGDYWAPCPFHAEKTPSFHVDDQKGFYYCFGCHEKGDIVGFAMATDNLSFPEAVEKLAAQAGLELPQRDPRAREKADARTQLVEVMEEAIRFYRLQLKTAAAAEARAYLERRGLSEADQTRFEIGFAPDTRGALTQQMTGKGIDAQKLVETGMAIQPDDARGPNSAPFDRFRGRIMFPIRDARGAAIGFGGRALDPNARAKYLNSPSTTLFDKGNTLFNFQPAREAAGKGGTLIVAEGYMDVIALVTHGFEATVAPNGTAITADQLRLMWRIAPEPVIVLDGDKAGRRAAEKLIDLAMPHLAPGRSLRFVTLPEGLDPDDLLRQQGRAAMATLLDEARSLFDVMWARETQSAQIDTPERRAALDTRLRQLLGTIEDPSVRNHYGAEIKSRRNALFAPPPKAWSPTGQQGGQQGGQKGRGTGRGSGRGTSYDAAPQGRTKGTALAQAGLNADVDTRQRETMILGLCLAHPWLIGQNETSLDGVRFQSPDLAQMRDALLRLGPEARTADELRSALSQELGADALEKLARLSHIDANPLTHPGSDPVKAATALIDDIARHKAILGQIAETKEAQAELAANSEDEGLTWRLKEAAEARHKSGKSAFTISEPDLDQTNEDAAYLQKLLDDKAWIKK